MLINNMVKIMLIAKVNLVTVRNTQDSSTLVSRYLTN